MVDEVKLDILAIAAHRDDTEIVSGGTIIKFADMGYSVGILDLTAQHHGRKPEIRLLTACPACQQGLSRYTDDTSLVPEYIVVETLRRLHGEDWQQRFIDQVLQDGIELVLV